MRDILYQQENQIIDITTGEVIRKESFAEKQKEDFEKTRRVMQELGIEQQYNLTSISKDKDEYKNLLIKKNYTFNKVFRTEMRKLMRNKEFKLSLGAKGFIAHYQNFLLFPENSILVENERPTIESMKEDLGVGTNKIHNILKELEQYEIIKRVMLGNKFIIYFNPFIICGGYVTSETYDMFKKSRWSNESLI